MNNQGGNSIIHLPAFIGRDVCRKGTGVSNQEISGYLIALLIHNPWDQEADARVNYSTGYHGGRTALVATALFVWHQGKETGD